MYIGFETEDLAEDEGPILCNPDGTTTIEITKIDSLYNEDDILTVTADDILPVNYKKIDFFNDIILLFNARVTAEGDNIYLQTANEFNRNRNLTIKDWSDKIDEDNIEISTLLSNSTEIKEFEFTESDDIYNSDFKSKYDTGLNDYKRSEDGKTTVTETLKCSSTTRIADFTKLIGVDDEFTTEFNPRFLFANSVSRELSVYMEFGLDRKGSRDRSINYVHILTTRYSENTSDADNLVIAWKNEYSYADSIYQSVGISGTIYNRFYLNDELLTTDDDLIFLKSKFNLTGEDFADIEFNDVIYIETKRHGNGYFRVNEITNYKAGSSDLATVELIQVDLDLLDADDFESSEISLIQLGLSSSYNSSITDGETNDVIKVDVDNDYLTYNNNDGNPKRITDLEFITNPSGYSLIVDSTSNSNSNAVTFEVLKNSILSGFNFSDYYTKTESDDRYCLKSEIDDIYLNESNNLSDLASVTDARSNLDVYSKTEVDDNISESQDEVTSLIEANTQAISDLDDAVVHKEGEEEITGLKTFTKFVSLVKGFIINTFSSGFAGSGARLSVQNGKTELEIDRLRVRETITAYETEIQTIKGTNGDLYISSSEKAESVEEEDLALLHSDEYAILADDNIAIIL